MSTPVPKSSSEPRPSKGPRRHEKRKRRVVAPAPATSAARLGAAVPDSSRGFIEPELADSNRDVNEDVERT